jgi:hypothetical protein
MEAKVFLGPTFVVVAVVVVVLLLLLLLLLLRFSFFPGQACTMRFFSSAVSVLFQQCKKSALFFCSPVDTHE